MPWTNTSINQPNPIQNNSNQSDVKKNYNRAYAVRRDTDKEKNFSITLEDVDSTIINFLSKTLKIQVNDNGETISVPIIYGNPERWAAIKKDGFLRDNQGKILLPLIMIRRKSVENNKDLMTFNRYLHYQTMMKYGEKNKYDRFDLLNKGIFKSKPTEQIYSVTLPNHVNIGYECIIWTDYVDQNNKIVEQINYASKDYWGDRERLKFRARIDSYTIDQEVNDGEDRNVKTSFDLNVNAYLLNDTMVDSMSGIKNTTQKLFTIRKIKLEESLATSVSDINDSKNYIKDTTSVKDLPSDYEYVGTDTMRLKNQNVKNNDGANIIPKTSKTLTKTSFHPAPTKITDYGEDGWMAYDASYIYIYKSPAGWLKREISTFDYDYSAKTYVSGYDCNGDPIYTTLNNRPINTAFRIFQRFPDKFYHQIPYDSNDYGEDGWLSYDGEFFYIYSQSEWRRIPISLFNPY